MLSAAASDLVIWYYTPMALGAEPERSRQAVVVVDAMDELADFHGAPVELRDQEAALMAGADLVFDAGPSLCEAQVTASRRPLLPVGR